MSKVSNTKIAIIGQGYIGLPLAVASVKAGFTVIGYDPSKEKISLLNEGFSYIEDVKNIEIKEMLRTTRFIPTSDLLYLEECSIYIVCVPTPLTLTGEPDLSYLESAIIKIGSKLKRGNLVVIESTIAPKTTRDYVIPLLELKSGIDKHELLVSFSPERIDPKNTNWNLANIPKLVSGNSDLALIQTINYYEKLGIKTIKCESLEIAEMSKLLENSFRFINISFINELSLICHKIGIDPLKVIEAATTKPYGFMPFYPSIGAGGHCIPVDSAYLSLFAREVGQPSRFIELAVEINNSMPHFYAKKALELLGSFKDKRILIIGISYKPEISDTRESHALKLMDILTTQGAKVNWHDEIVKEWNGTFSSPLTNNYDLAVVAVKHKYINLKNLGNLPILDIFGRAT